MLLPEDRVHRVVGLQHIQDLRAALQEEGACEQGQEQDHVEDPVLRGEAGIPGGGDADGLLPALFDQRVAEQDQGGQDGEGADQADQHALRQGEAHVRPQAEAHERQAQEAGEGGQGAARHRRERRGDRRLHGGGVVRGGFFLLGVSVHEDDGIIHGKDQLHDPHDAVGVFREAGEDQVGPQVDGHGDPDVHQEDHRLEPGGAQGQQDQQHQPHGDDDHVGLQHRHVGLVDVAAGVDAGRVVPGMHRPVQGGRLRGVAVEGDGDLKEGIAVPAVFFSGLPGDFLRLLQP